MNMSGNLLSHEQYEYRPIAHIIFLFVNSNHTPRQIKIMNSHAPEQRYRRIEYLYDHYRSLHKFLLPVFSIMFTFTCPNNQIMIPGEAQSVAGSNLRRWRTGTYFGRSRQASAQHRGRQDFVGAESCSCRGMHGGSMGCASGGRAGLCEGDRDRWQRAYP